MVALYSAPDQDLYEESFWTVYSVTKLPSNEGLHVIRVQDIMSVVSMQPHLHHLSDGKERFFVGEKFGLDVGLLGGIEEPLEG